MRAIVINVAGETQRMQFQAEQLEALGIAFDRFAAVTSADLPFPQDSSYWRQWERPMRVVEMSAFASHQRVWMAVSEGREPVLVLEDDAVLMPGVPAFLERISRMDGLDHVTLEFRGRKKLLARRHHRAAPIRRLWQDRTGAAAYVLWPQGARKLLACKPGLADAVICAAYQLRSFQADPALAIQIDQCAEHGIDPPISSTSSILAVTKPSLRGLPASLRMRFRLRRAMAQVRMGIRYAARISGSERCFVALDRRVPELMK